MITDIRFKLLAENLCNYSVDLQNGDNVLIHAFDTPQAMIVELVKAARARGATPFVEISSSRISREIMRGANDNYFEILSKNELEKMKNMQAYIAIRGSDNIFESSDVPSSQMALASKYMKGVLDWRVNKTKWVILRWPTGSMAQQAKMSTEEFEDFYFNVCTLDYSKMQKGVEALKDLMRKTDKVRIQSEGTDLTFSIKNIAPIECIGLRNIPDGEVYTAPIKDSVNGVISYNVPTIYQGVEFNNVVLHFENGKIIKASSNNTKRLNEILDTDAGSRYVGEFAMGFNPHITRPILDILFDEKIAGSIHFTPGQCYEEASNGNDSSIHWDMVLVQTPQHGGGTIEFDGVVIRKDGLFVLEELKALNPDYLLSK